MLDRLDNELHFQRESLRLLNYRQNILAANIAHADTPGYQARDMDFSHHLQNAIKNNHTGMAPIVLKTTSANHLSSRQLADESSLLFRIADQPSADGNTVDMDRERVHFSDNAVKYQTSLTILNTELKNIMSVLN